jgi:hypothetical protein
MLLPGIPEKEVKNLLSKRQEGPIKIIKQDLVRGEGVSS